MKNLTVYKASAGSGKTFTLAVSYLKLLIRNPQNHRSILAVTFTNKATEEMKTRILSQLYGIWQGLKSSDDYLKAICSDLDISEDYARKQAGTALHLLLHDYSRFRVETIDSFFQSVLRELAHELDLTTNLRIELNGKMVEEQAVDALIDNIQDDHTLQKLIMTFIRENIDNDKGWNVIKGVKKFGETIFKDEYQNEKNNLIGKADNAKFCNNYRQTMRTIRQIAEERLTQIGAEFGEKLNDYGLTVGDLKNRERGIASFFNKLATRNYKDLFGKTIKNAMEGDYDVWHTKNNPKTEVIRLAAQEIFMPQINEARNLFIDMNTSELTEKHIYELQLLHRIEMKVEEMNHDNYRFLLSNTQKLLHDVIGSSDTPFIYEKTGARLTNIMIDEFQDTGALQWANFKVLLDDCMAHNDGNLIVGDVKQSIYRWRSGDWRLLNNIDKIFEHELLEIKSLQTNYRSQRNIIAFNNAFFKHAAAIEANLVEKNTKRDAKELITAYADVHQEVAKKEGGGYVSVKLLLNNEYDTMMLEEIAATLRRLVDAGIPQNKIAVLMREKKYIPLLADYMTVADPEIKLISDEAFRLDASIVVNMIVCALRLIVHPDDTLTEEVLRQFAHGQLPEDFNLQKLKVLPTYELIEKIYSIFDMEKIEGQSAYVAAFYDKIAEMSQDSIVTVETIVDAWDDNICETTIQSDELTGVRMLTVHVSKGLEFDNVIIPYSDWQVDKYNEILWCKPDKPPYNDFPILPIDYSKKMAGTIYESYYNEEYLQQHVDNLNIMYVAFTRAARSLFIIGKRNGSSNHRSKVIEECITKIAPELGATLTGIDNPDIALEFEYGSLVVPNASASDSKGSKTDRNVFLKQPDIQDISIQSFKDKFIFRQSNKSRDFISGEDLDDDRKEYIRMGLILHDILSKINTTDDIPTSVERLRNEGILDEKSAAKVNDLLTERLSSTQAKDWFSGHWKLYNECTILDVDEDTMEVTIRRPDRVMTDGDKYIVVDFKFGVPKPEHRTQVAEYMSLIQSMTHANVEGFLWYVYNNNITKVS